MRGYYLGLYVGASLKDFESVPIPSEGYETLLDILTEKYDLTVVIANKSKSEEVEDCFLGWEVSQLNLNSLDEVVGSLVESFLKTFRLTPEVFVGSLFY